MRLHMLSIPHTRTTSKFSHCAFTGKVRRFGPMMKAQGYEVWHYGIVPPDTAGWARHINVLSWKEQEKLLGYNPETTGAKFVGDDANIGHPLYQAFNAKLKDLLAETVAPDDIICAPFGKAHEAAFDGPRRAQTVETGIGYPDACCGYRIYESYVWQAWHSAKEGRSPWDSEWVVPNYFDEEEWPLREQPAGKGEFVLFMGRISSLKGMNEIVEIATARPKETFVVCGQGDASPWVNKAPNLQYHPPVHGMERAKLMHRAKYVLMPSRFLEPFGGVAVEAMMTGTPVLTTDFGAFAETIPYPSLRCHTLSQFLSGMDRIEGGMVDREMLREIMRARYSLSVCGRKYDQIFQTIPQMWKKGWYA